MSPEEAYRVLKQAYAVIKQIENHAEHEKYSENEQSRVAAQEQAVVHANQMVAQCKATEAQRSAECVKAIEAFQAACEACREAVDEEARDKNRPR